MSNSKSKVSKITGIYVSISSLMITGKLMQVWNEI